MIDLKGKVAVVFGLANKRSIAYSVAQKLAEAGATIVLSYQSDRLKAEAEELLRDLGQTATGKGFQCDVYIGAQKLAEAGATIVLSYQSDRLKAEAEELLRDLGQTATGKGFQCDV